MHIPILLSNWLKGITNWFWTTWFIFGIWFCRLVFSGIWIIRMAELQYKMYSPILYLYTRKYTFIKVYHHPYIKYKFEIFTITAKESTFIYIKIDYVHLYGFFFYFLFFYTRWAFCKCTSSFCHHLYYITVLDIYLVKWKYFCNGVRVRVGVLNQIVYAKCSI